jgi:predicted dehydrogenase
MQFKVGVIGATGYIGTPYRQEIREAAGQATIVALCARRRELLEAAGREDGALLLTDDWQQVVEHPDVNLVLVATPDALHHEEVMAAAAAGKHIFCEKPVGVSAQQALEMKTVCRDAGVAHYVPFWTRYVPVFARAREIYQTGTLGEIQAVVYRWHNPRPISMPFTWRDDAQLSAAGSIADVGSHAYDAMRWILGQEVVRVLAHADVISPAKPDLGAINLGEALQWGEAHAVRDTPTSRQGTAFDYAAIALQWDSGAVGSLTLSHAPSLRKGLAPELELHGSKASLAIDRISSVLTIARGEQPETEAERIDNPGFGNRFDKYVFPALRAQLAGEPTEHPDLEDGWRVQQFTDAVVRSAQQGGWAKVQS